MDSHTDRVSEVFLYAINNSQYYKQKAAESSASNIEDFLDFPILNREELRKNRDAIFSDEYCSTKTKLMRCVRTSGSTGQFVEAFWTNKNFFASNLCLWRKRFEWYGITPTSKKCTFFTRERYKSSKLDTNIRMIKKEKEILFSCIYMDDTDMDKYYDEIMNFNPEWLYVTPSVLTHILNYWEKKEKKSINTVKYIELFGENVGDRIKIKAQKFFPNANIAVMYGTQEVNGIALTCKYGCMHVLEDNVYLENDEENNAIVTSLKNREFPIIRYQNGDKISLNVGECKCGCKGRYIERLFGRSNDFMIIDSKTGLTTHAIKDAIHVTDTIFDYPILQYKVFKDELINIAIFCDEKFVNWKKSICENLASNLRKMGLEDKDYFIKFCDEPIEISVHSGKMQ